MVTATAVAWYFYSQGPKDISKSTAVQITASDLYRAYAKDSVAAQAQFSGKVLLVRGVVEDLQKNQQAETIVFLQTGEEAAFINCTMDKHQESVHIDDTVTLKGICMCIGEADAELGIKADVYVTR